MDKIEYLFKKEERTQLEDFDLEVLLSIEKRLIEGISEEEAEYFLEWLGVKIRWNLDQHPFCFDEHYPDMQVIASNMAEVILKKLNLYYEYIRIVQLWNEDMTANQAIVITLKTKKGHEIVEVQYIFDPTFIQYCTLEPVHSAGYSFSENPEGIILATQLMNKMFICCEGLNSQRYLGAFFLGSTDPKIIESCTLAELCINYVEHSECIPPFDDKIPSEMVSPPDIMYQDYKSASTYTQ